jgi:hypothetical protein
MRTYAHVCARMLTCVHGAVGRMLTYGDVCLGMQVYIEQSDVRIKRMARKVPPLLYDRYTTYVCVCVYVCRCVGAPTTLPLILPLSLSLSLYIYILYMYIYIHTHTHTHTHYIYIYGNTYTHTHVYRRGR